MFFMRISPCFGCLIPRLEDAADTREADRIYAAVKVGKVKVVPLA